MTIDHPGNAANSFRYTICWDVNATGNPTWCQIRPSVGGLGWRNQGGGVALTQLDSDPRPEMVMMGIDHPGGKSNEFWYTIGWNLDTTGNASSWSSVKKVGAPGWEARYGDIAFSQLDADPRPDIVLMTIDPTSQYFDSYRYIVGWNVDGNGDPTSWSNMVQVDTAQAVPSTMEFRRALE